MKHLNWQTSGSTVLGVEYITNIIINTFILNTVCYTHGMVVYVKQ